jgi:6-phosphogluconolactonase
MALSENQTNAQAAIRWSDDGSDDAVVAHLELAILQRGARRMALPGGSTPVPIYRRLAGRSLPWADITLVPTDERLVDRIHPASNFGALQRAFATTKVTVCPLREGTRFAPFDLIWLGMGEDGHIASLWPGQSIGFDGSCAIVRTCPEPLPAEAPFERLSLPLAALIDTNEIIVVVRGRKKRELLIETISIGNDLPIGALFRSATAPITVYADGQHA